MSTTVLIVDDHAAFRSFARGFLDGEGYDVVGEASTGTQGLAAARELGPDLVLLDVQLPDKDGFEVAEELSGDAVRPAIVLTSVRAASDYGRRLITSPVNGFVSKADLSKTTLAAAAGGL